MLVASKNQVWQDLEQRFSRTVDALGKRIDSGIMDTVVALNANNIHTTASCEGHLDWGTPYPWVDIGSEDPRIAELEQHIADLLFEGKRTETEPLYLEISHLNYLEEIKIVQALNVFYQHHSIEYDRHLIFVHDIRGECRIRSQGGDTQEMRSPEEKIQKIQEYQQEMADFTAFLKQCYFQDEL